MGALNVRLRQYTLEESAPRVPKTPHSSVLHYLPVCVWKRVTIMILKRFVKTKIPPQQKVLAKSVMSTAISIQPSIQHVVQKVN